MKKKKGFTLVELIGVVVILGLVALVAFPSLLNQINNSKKQIIITLTGKNSTDNKIIDFINDENGIKIKSFQWNKQDTFNFITTIKTVSGKKILSSGNLRLQGLEGVDVHKPADEIYNVFINYF